MDSSPFIERPGEGATGNPHSSPVRATPPLPLNRITSQSQSTTDQLHTEIYTLRYQLKELGTELNITKLESETKQEELLQKLEAKSQEFDEISSNNVYLFKQNEELAGKLEHLEENFKKKETSMETTIRSLTADLSKHKKGYEELMVKNRSIVSKMEKLQMDQEMKHNEITSEINQLRYDNESKDREIESLKSKLEEQSKELTKVQQRSSKSSNNSISSEDYQLVKSQLSDQVQYIQSLEKKNLSQSEEIKKLNVSKQNSEILRSQNAQLTQKLQKALELVDVNAELDLKLAELGTKLENFKLLLGEVDEDNIEEALKRMHVEKEDHEILKTNYEDLSKEYKNINERHNDLVIELQQLTTKLQTSQTQLTTLQRLNKELELQRDLSFEESKILRAQLNELTDELQVSENDKDSYIKSLEVLVDDYKVKLEKKSQELVNEVSHNKRPREEGNAMDEETTRSYQLSNDKLKEELFNLQNKHTKLSNENIILLKKLENLNKLQQVQQKTYRVIQLRSNPLANDQFVKKEHIELLQKENESLKSLNKLEDSELIPKAVYETLQFETKQLDIQISQLTKKSLRLQQLYKEKSKEMIEIINHTLGYKLEFISSSKVKIFSKFSKEDFITFDAQANTLKTSTSRYSGEEGMPKGKSFEQICNQLIQFWVKEKGEVGLFLAALNLELFERRQNN